MTTTRKPIRTSRGTRLRAAVPSRKTRAASRWSILRNGRMVRWSRIQTAQARIASGFYERDEVQAFVVDAILRELKRH
jgi:hypothetical protein